MEEGLAVTTEALVAMLADVNRQLAGMGALQIRQRRLIEAIRAVEAVNAPVNGSLKGRSDFAELVQRVTSTTFAASQIPAPSSTIAAAYRVLQEAHQPLHIREMIALIQSKGWFTDREYEALRSTIAGALDAKVKAKDTYTKIAPAIYGLLDWEKDTDLADLLEANPD